MVNQGLLSGQTLEKCTTCNGNHTSFSNRRGMEAEAAMAAQLPRGGLLAGQASMNVATNVALGTNRVAIRYGLTGTAKEGGGSEADLADVEEEEATGHAEDFMMTEITTTATTDTLKDTETGLLGHGDYTNPIQLRSVI